MRRGEKSYPRRDTKDDEGPLRGCSRLERDAPRVGKGVNEGHQGQKGSFREGATRTAAKPVVGASHHIVTDRDDQHRCTGYTGFFQETAGFQCRESANPHPIIARAGFWCRNRLTNSSNVYSRPFQTINVYYCNILDDFRRPSANPKHPLKSTAIPHIIRG